MSARLSTGGCQCGAVRYRISTLPLETYICHCTECRKQSASAFGISVIVDSASVEVTRGAPKRWSRPTAGGGMLDCYFCPDCGTRLWHQGGDDKGRLSVKGGSLDQPVDLRDVPHIWTRSKLEGIVIPDHVARFSEEPDEP
ncbi:MAG: GFA family protein [Alphaproteobacteria bacterium]